MNFNLKKPCSDCPFRCDVEPYLTKDRVLDICNAMISEQKTFACHKTTGIDGEKYKKSAVEHCAGALVFLETLNRPNQMMRIADRLGYYDRTKLNMKSPVFKTVKKMVSVQPY